MDREEKLEMIMNENIEVFRDWAKHIVCAMKAELEFINLLGENDEANSGNNITAFRENMREFNGNIDKALKNIGLIQNAKTLFSALGKMSPCARSLTHIWLQSRTYWHPMRP